MTRLPSFDLRPSPGLVDRLTEAWHTDPDGLPDGTSWATALVAAADADRHRSQWGAVWQAFAAAAVTLPQLVAGSSLDVALEGMLRTALRSDGFTRTDAQHALDAACDVLARASSPAAASRCLAAWVEAPQERSAAIERFLKLGASPHQMCAPDRTVFQRAVERLWVDEESAEAWTQAGVDWDSTTAAGHTVLHLVLSGDDTPPRRSALKAANGRVRARLWAVPDAEGISARDRLAQHPSLQAAFPAIRRRAEGAVARRHARATEQVLDTELPKAPPAFRRRM